MFNEGLGRLGKVPEGTAAMGQEQLCCLGCIRQHQCLHRVVWDSGQAVPLVAAQLSRTGSCWGASIMLCPLLQLLLGGNSRRAWVSLPAKLFALIINRCQAVPWLLAGDKPGLAGARCPQHAAPCGSSRSTHKCRWGAGPSSSSSVGMRVLGQAQTPRDPSFSGCCRTAPCPCSWLCVSAVEPLSSRAG